MTPKKYSVILAIMAILLSSISFATTLSSDRLYKLADQQYDAGDYETAVHFLKMAVREEPDNSRIHHLLAKSYGRIAENSNWISAIELTLKTRKGLEKAVELDGKNIPALRDLIEFYRQAPAFLGGDHDKANTLTEKIERLRALSQYSPRKP